MIIIAIIAFLLGGVTVIVQDVFSKNEKQSYLYVFNRETNAWDRASLLDLKLTLCNDLKVFDKEN